MTTGERIMQRVLAAIAGTALIAGVFAAAERASAHHSTSMYDHSKTLTIRGKVVELRWVNPHVSITVNGRVGNSTIEEEWVMEMTSPGNLVRAGGWSRNAVKAGDDVTVEFNPLRDATLRGGALKKITVLASGKSYTANLRAQEMPGLE
jgi:Family of unknown function (DUF6152)